MPGYLSEEVVTSRVMNAVAAGTSNQNGSVVDMAGYDAVRFTGLFGALTATQVTGMKAQQGDQSDGSDMADISGAATAAMADTDSNKALILDVSRLSITKRYVRCVVTRGTANAVIDGVIADQYKGRSRAVSQGSTVSSTKQV